MRVFTKAAIAAFFVLFPFFAMDVESEDVPTFTNSDLEKYGDRPTAEKLGNEEKSETDSRERAHPRDEEMASGENERAVVAVFALTKEGKPVGHGSGFIARPEGVIVTSYHVIGNAANIKIRAGGKILDVEGLIYSDMENDVALLKAKGEGLPTVRFGDSDTLREGEKVYVISSPGGHENAVSEGVFKGTWDLGGNRRVLRISASFSKGSSGGPVFNEAGEVIGVATFILKEAQGFRGEVKGLNFAAPANLIRDKLLVAGVTELKDAWTGDHKETPEYWTNIGNDLNRSGRHAEAAEAFKKALAANSDSAGALNGLGVAYMKLNKSKEAIEIYRKVLRLEPSAWAYSNLGVVYIEAGMYREAVEVLEEAARIAPDLEAAHLNLGLAYRKLSRYGDAVKAYRKAIGINDGSADAHFGLGLTQIDLSNKGAALEEYRILKGIDPAMAERLLNLINR